MAVNRDFRDLFSALAAADVRFLVVGAYAVIHYTEPRYTKDLDLWIEPTRVNAERAREALQMFGAPTAGLTARHLRDPDVIYQIGIEPNRIDVLTKIAGVTFDRAWRRASRTTYGGVPIRVLSLEDLVKSKRKAGRPQDQLDLTRLEDVRRRIRLRRRRRRSRPVPGKH